MNRVILAGILWILTVAPLKAGAPQKGVFRERICASDFPKTASRAMFFEDRINSKDSAVRLRVLLEVGYFYSLPESDYVGFLKRMMKDPDQGVRGQAIKKLYDMWVPQWPESLPVVFTGYHNNQVVDRESETTVSELIEQCSNGGRTGGYAAYVLGLLRVKEAIPALRSLQGDGNVFVQYTAARALLDCGDGSTAIAIFDEISSKQLELYASVKAKEDAERGLACVSLGGGGSCLASCSARWNHRNTSLRGRERPEEPSYRSVVGPSPNPPRQLPPPPRAVRTCLSATGTS